MPLFKGTIFKHTVQNPSEEWSNVYHVNAADNASAMTLLVFIMNREREISYDNVVFTKGYVRLDSPVAPSGLTNVFEGIVGERASDPANQLPLFNTVRVTLTDGVNRPDQKYLRLPLQVTDVTGDFIDEETLDLIQTEYVNPLTTTGGIVSSSGDDYSSGAPHGAIQMRQLHWSRRSRPGFKRGYVPA